MNNVMGYNLIKCIFIKFSDGKIIVSGQPVKTTDLLNQKTDKNSNIVGQALRFERKYAVNNSNKIDYSILMEEKVAKFNAEMIPKSTCNILS